MTFSDLRRALLHSVTIEPSEPPATVRSDFLGKRDDRWRSAIDNNLEQPQTRSKRSRFITFVHTATKSRTNFS
jgi:hypothetical protein